jgi:hypothetical protein
VYALEDLGWASIEGDSPPLVNLQMKEKMNEAKLLPSNIAEILKCKACGSTDILVKKSENETHAASLRCIDCGSFRWLSKKEAERALINWE